MHWGGGVGSGGMGQGGGGAGNCSYTGHSVVADCLLCCLPAEKHKAAAVKSKQAVNRTALEAQMAQAAQRVQVGEPWLAGWLAG